MRTISDPKELASMPNGTVIRDGRGDVFERSGYLETEHVKHSAWCAVMSPVVFTENDVSYPVLVLWPVGGQTQFHFELATEGLDFDNLEQIDKLYGDTTVEFHVSEVDGVVSVNAFCEAETETEALEKVRAGLREVGAKPVDDEGSS